MSQVWLVTGSSRGLVRAIVEASLAADNKVMATARNTESLNELSNRYGNQVNLFALDVTDESAATAAGTQLSIRLARWTLLSTSEIRQSLVCRRHTHIGFSRANRNEPLRDDHCDKGGPSVFPRKEGRSFCSIFFDGRKDWTSGPRTLLGCEMGR